MFCIFFLPFLYLVPYTQENERGFRQRKIYALCPFDRVSQRLLGTPHGVSAWYLHLNISVLTQSSLYQDYYLDRYAYDDSAHLDSNLLHFFASKVRFSTQTDLQCLIQGRNHRLLLWLWLLPGRGAIRSTCFWAIGCVFSYWTFILWCWHHICIQGVWYDTNSFKS